MIPALPRWAWMAIGGVFAAIALVGAIWAIHRDGYKNGKRDADAAWQAASDRLIEKANKAGAKADKNAAGRAADFAAKQQDEKEKIERATEDGSSPFDVLFND